MLHRMCGALVALFALAPASAFAQPLEAGQFAGGLSIGADVPIEGDVHGGAIAPVASLRALNPNLPAVPAELRIGARSFDDIYGEALAVELEGAYGIGAQREVFGILRYSKADEGSVQVGTAFVPALSASVPVTGTFSDYETTSLEAGVRQYFGGGAFKPYVAGRLGVGQVEEVRASFRVAVPAGVGAEPNDIVLTDVPFYGDSTTWTAGVDVGVSYAFTDRYSLSLETGLRYQGELDGDDRAIGPLGLGSINDEGSRFSVPITLRSRLAF